MRIRRLARRDHAGRPAALVDRDHLDAIQIIGCQAELAAEKAKRAAGDVPAHADLRVFAERYHDSPRLGESAERLAYCGPRLDGDRPPFRVVIDALHGRDIDDHAHVGIGNEPLEAMSAAGRDETPSLRDRLLHRRYHLLGGTDESNVVGARAEPLVEALLDDRAIPRIFRADSQGLPSVSATVGTVLNGFDPPFFHAS